MNSISAAPLVLEPQTVAHAAELFRVLGGERDLDAVTQWPYELLQ
jgi:hypothetical protein